MKVRPLRPGEPVHVVGISGPVGKERIRRGMKWIETRGHPVKAGKALLERHGFLAGTDTRRASDLRDALADRESGAIFFSRGGWGAARILDRVDLKVIRSRPRVLLGFSDLTSLFMALQRPRSPYPYRYGPTVAQLGEAGAFHRPSLEESLYLPSPAITRSLAGCRVLRTGRARGTLLGGCLTLLVGLLGTPYDVSWDGCILFWEEVNEEPYVLDRMLNQLRLAGKLRNLSGMVVGKLVGSTTSVRRASLALNEILMDATAGTNYPVVTGFPAGHMAGKRTLLMGVPSVLDTAGRHLTASTRASSL